MGAYKKDLSKKISFRISEEEYKKLKELSAIYKKPMSDVLRTSIDDTYMQASWLGLVTPEWDKPENIEKAKLRREIENLLSPKKQHSHFRVNGKNRKYGR